MQALTDQGLEVEEEFGGVFLVVHEEMVRS